ncbi:hypothetical protein GPECTOR_80g166 [Gonium pectorale]|uniref:Uncharacterized protein n=1 Tax=Gonium pectorale TaxID=33097 RepID=A0A150G1Q3_GONPE|nr:hypothetical protein GPECTOR_80g166 [Gonium pectorale]|eukprot:KXZ43806.1 hypothetical protein GPECTOR_80g166 [Gonium pectorale]
MELALLTPAALQRQAEPYKRLLGILLRPTCVSISVSNPYLSLAEPAGAVLLRGGKVPERTLLKLLQPFRSELTGVVIGSEAHRHWRDLVAAERAADSLRQVHSVLQSVSPGLPAAWWDRWSPDTPASCRLPGTAPGAPLPEPPPGPGRLEPAGGSPSWGPAEVAPPLVHGVSGRGAASRPGSPTGPGPSAAPGPVCSMGTLFLQHYLDQLGQLNTFG